ncbi:MAG: biopolymer transporter ExbD [Candidatus Aminicenantes bacterium]|jgi:biopolymer transport protein ExbD
MAGVDLGGSKESKAEPNVVPLCDILLVLLIIFMVVTPMFKGNGTIKLPEAENIQNQPEPFSMLTVFIEEDGTIYLDEEPVSDLERLAYTIEERIQGKNQSEKSKLLLKADEDVIYERVNQVMTEIQRAQIEIVGLVAQKRVAIE